MIDQHMNMQMLSLVFTNTDWNDSMKYSRMLEVQGWGSSLLKDSATEISNKNLLFESERPIKIKPPSRSGLTVELVWFCPCIHTVHAHVQAQHTCACTNTHGYMHSACTHAGTDTHVHAQTCTTHRYMHTVHTCRHKYTGTCRNTVWMHTACIHIQTNHMLTCTCTNIHTMPAHTHEQADTHTHATLGELVGLKLLWMRCVLGVWHLFSQSKSSHCLHNSSLE